MRVYPTSFAFPGVSSHSSSFQDGEMIEDDEFADFEKHDNVTWRGVTVVSPVTGDGLSRWNDMIDYIRKLRSIVGGLRFKILICQWMYGINGINHIKSH